MPHRMQDTVIFLFAICGLASSSSTPSPTTTTEKPILKRGIYEDEFNINGGYILKNSQPKFYESSLTNEDLFQTDFDRKSLYPTFGRGSKIQPPKLFFGYAYPRPRIPFYEDRIPRFIDINIAPAIQPRTQNNLPESDAILTAVQANYRQRRLITPVNEKLFYKFPGYVSDDGITVRVPLQLAKPSRIVVPQHKTIALGSGGYGYSMLPGGRIAIGSGSRAYSNLARTRASPLPPLPTNPNRSRFREQAAALPYQMFPLRREYDDEPPTGANSTFTSNALTVFPQSQQDLLYNWQN